MSYAADHAQQCENQSAGHGGKKHPQRQADQATRQTQDAQDGGHGIRTQPNRDRKDPAHQPNRQSKDRAHRATCVFGEAAPMDLFPLDEETEWKPYDKAYQGKRQDHAKEGKNWSDKKNDQKPNHCPKGNLANHVSGAVQAFHDTLQAKTKIERYRSARIEIEPYSLFAAKRLFFCFFSQKTWHGG
jgi:hypothetical protein